MKRAVMSAPIRTTAPTTLARRSRERTNRAMIAPPSVTTRNGRRLISGGPRTRSGSALGSGRTGARRLVRRKRHDSDRWVVAVVAILVGDRSGRGFVDGRGGHDRSVRESRGRDGIEQPEIRLFDGRSTTG